MRLLRFRHARIARESEETATSRPISDRYFEFAIPGFARKRSPTIVHCRLFVSLISEPKCVDKQGKR